MPLQNRVTPEGDIIACEARGTMFGNRGGALHTADRKLTSRRWKTKAWICCVLEFKGRHRVVMSPNRYTELFFLDEATALAAGHRPCFECRRHDALRFAEAWRAAFELQRRPSAPEMDRRLQEERIRRGGGKVTYTSQLAGLPDGTFVRMGPRAYLLHAGRLLAWTPAGYAEVLAATRQQTVEVLTPRSIVAVLSARYRPKMHATAEAALGSPRNATPDY
ncbi:MAG: hypothetical protein ACM31O_11560 [Bacteroidota bacterium]